MKKNIKVMGYVLWIMVVLFVSTPLTAQNAQQEWQSTSTMQGSGSAYSSQVTSVGATGVATMGTTPSAPSNVQSGPRRVIGTNQDAGEKDPSSPLGDAVLPLMLCACAYLIVRATRRRTLNR